MTVEENNFLQETKITNNRVLEVETNSGLGMEQVDNNSYNNENDNMVKDEDEGNPMAGMGDISRFG